MGFLDRPDETREILIETWIPPNKDYYIEDHNDQFAPIRILMWFDKHGRQHRSNNLPCRIRIFMDVTVKFNYYEHGKNQFRRTSINKLKQILRNSKTKEDVKYFQDKLDAELEN